MLDKELDAGGFLLGARLSVADVYLAMLYAWHPGQRRADLTALTHRVAAHGLIAPVWQRNFDHRLAIKWGREEA